MATVVPFMQKHVATRGAAISVDNPHEGATYPYPLLITLSDQDEQLVFDLARAVDVHYEEYKNSDPGSIGGRWIGKIFSGLCRFTMGRALLSVGWRME